MQLHQRLQRCIQAVYKIFLRERQAQKEKSGSYDECVLLKNFYVEFSVKEAKEMTLDDYYERVKNRKIARKGRKQMNLLETILNIQVFKPYYPRVARSLLKNLQPLPL